MHTVLAASPHLETLPPRAKRPAGSKDHPIRAAKHGPFGKVLDPDMTQRRDIELCEGKHEPAVAAGRGSWRLE